MNYRHTALLVLALAAALSSAALLLGVLPSDRLILAGVILLWIAVVLLLWRRVIATEALADDPAISDEGPEARPGAGPSLPYKAPLREGDHCAFSLYNEEELAVLEGQTYEGALAPSEANAFRPGPWASPDLDGLSEPARELIRSPSVSTESELFRRIVAERHPWARLQEGDPLDAADPSGLRRGSPPPATDVPVEADPPDVGMPATDDPGFDGIQPGGGGTINWCVLPMSTGVDQLPVLADACRIHLGELNLGDGSFLDLFTDLPSTYRPTRTREAMLAFCAPWLVDALGDPARQGFTETDAHRMILYPTMVGELYSALSPPGLFWPEGYFHNSFVLSLLLLHRYAELADPPQQFAEACDFSPAGLREDMESRRFHVFMFSAPVCGWRDITDSGFFQGPAFDIAVNSWGKVRPTRFYHGASGWAFMQNVHICAAMKMEAALADYYLWWAQRLFSYALDGLSPRPVWDLYMAILCARCGITELFELGALVVHEYCHLFGGSLWHCSRGRRTFACCQYAIELLYRNRACAMLGLPTPHMAVGARVDRDLPPATMGAAQGLRLRSLPWAEFLSPGECPRGPEQTLNLITQPALRAEHDGLLEPHSLTFTWNLGDDCTGPGQSQNSSQTYSY